VRTQPAFAALAMIPIFSLAGVPPLSGFLGKLAILECMFDSRAYGVGAMVLVVGLLTLVSMGRTWAEAFWRPAGATVRDMSTPGTALIVAIAGLSLVTVAISVGAGPLFELTSRAAHQLLQRDDYMRAVLGGAP
jgi:multicomponent Na+:H+ antiporter subunit D